MEMQSEVVFHSCPKSDRLQVQHTCDQHSDKHDRKWMNEITFANKKASIGGRVVRSRYGAVEGLAKVPQTVEECSMSLYIETLTLTHFCHVEFITV